MRNELLCLVVGGALLGAACAPARTALPPAPPPRPESELAVWRTPPPLAPDSEISLPFGITRVSLDNGLGVTVVTRPETKTTAIELWLPSAGDSSSGKVAVMAEMLRAGSRVKAQVMTNPRLAFQAVNINTSASGTSFNWQVLPRATEQALGLLSSFVFAPVFEPEETQSRLREQLTYIQRYSGSAEHRLNLTRDALPGIDLPSPEVDARGLFKLDQKALRALHRCAISPRAGELVIAGPRTFDQVIPWARAAFGGVAAAAPDPSCDALKLATHDPEQTRLDRIELQIIYGGSFDPVLMMAVPGPSLTSDEYLAFALLEEVLEGRDAGSAQALRHMGATYGIHSWINTSFPGLSLLEISGQVEPDNAQAALRQLITDMRELEQTLTEQQLEEVKRRWRNSYVTSLSSNGAVADSALWQIRRGRAPEAMKQWPNELMAVSLAQCRDVARHWLTNAQPAVTVTGVPVKLVRGLNMGGVNLREMLWTDELQAKKKGF
jgi:predicted Zn-dependent peptidase